jgi:hypothetical protein
MKWVIPLLGLLLFGCQAPNVEPRTPTENDTPFGGGFPPSHRAGGDPYRSYERRQEIRPFAQPQQQQNRGNDPAR